MNRGVGLLLLGGGFLGAAALLARAVSSAPGIVSPQAFESQPSVSVSPAEKARHEGAAAVMRGAFKRVMGRDPSAAELQYALAVAWLETSYGNGWKGAMVGSNNWGAVQCPLNAQTAPDCVPYQDSHSSGEKYSVAFRKYASAEDGAADVVKHVFKNRPVTASVLASGEPSIFRASYAMRRERYYGGFCPKATSRYGADCAKQSFANPDATECTKACAREAVELHAKVAGGNVQKIASALGQPAIAMGSYDDADAWWAGGHVSGSSGPLRRDWILSIVEGDCPFRDPPWLKR